MTVKVEKVSIENEQIVDDISDVKVVGDVVENTTPIAGATSTADVNMDKLAELKARLNAQKGKEEKKINTHKKSLNYGVIGLGECGGRLAERFFVCSYPSICFNTASADLNNLKLLPASNKFLLASESGLEGAAKTLSIGKDAIDNNIDKVKNTIREQLSDTNVLFICSSMSGGSGAGSLKSVIDLCQDERKPIVVIAVLPMTSDDLLAKQNTLSTISDLSKLIQAKKINNLILVDNTKLENILSDVNQFMFFDTANKQIVDPLDIFNTLSSVSGQLSKSMDQVEWAKTLIDSNGISTYGTIEVDNWIEETAIAEAILNNLNNGLLASGVDIKTASYVSFLVVAPKSIWEKLPNSSLTYALSLVNELSDACKAVYKGYYINDDLENIKIYSFFSGMGMPLERIHGINKEVQDLEKINKEKDSKRNINLNINLGTQQDVSEAQKVKDRISAKNSAFGKLIGSDKRNK